MTATPLVSAALAAYRLAGRAAAPWLRQHLRRRAERGREDPARLGERLGRPSLERPPGTLVWLHAASVGESLSALPLVERIRAGWPQHHLLMTTGTVTSAKLMAERLPEGVLHQFAPIDLAPSIEGFLAHWRPSLGLLLESELWPNLLTCARARGCDLVLVNGRMSPASYASWRRWKPVIGHLLEQFSLILAQSPQDESHYADLGARQVRYIGNLKFAGPPLAADPVVLAALERGCTGRVRWLAASTHPGEDEIVGEVHRELAAAFPGLLTLIVPRHPERGPAIAQQLRDAGLTVALRSAGEPIATATEVYVADTIGELGLWYRLAEAVFIGKSLVPKGGQNPIEAAKLGCAILAGPHCDNFKQVTREMLAAGALGQVADGPALAAAMRRLLGDAEIRTAMTQAAQRYGMAQAGVLDGFVAALKPHLDRAAESASPPRAA